MLLTQTLQPPAAAWGPAPFLVVCLLSAAATWALERRLPILYERLLLTGLAFLVSGTVFRLHPAGFLGGLWFWWRGLHVAQGGLGIESAVLRFRWAVLALVWVLLVGLLFGPLDAVPAVLAAFVLGLLAVGLARMESSGAPGLTPPQAARWLAIFLTATGTVVGLAWGALLFLRSELFQTLWRPLAGLLDRLLWNFLLLFALLISPVLNLLINALRGLGLSGLERNPLEALENLRRTMESQAPEASGSSPVLEILKWAGLAALLLLVGLALAVSVSRGEDEDRPDGAGERERLDGQRPGLGGVLAGQLAGLWARGEAALRRRQARPAVWTVRKLYREMLLEAAEEGHPRRPPETPLEFQEELDEVFAGFQVEVSALTRAYLLVRYGDRQPDEEQLRQLVEAYERLRPAAEGEADA